MRQMTIMASAYSIAGVWLSTDRKAFKAGHIPFEKLSKEAWLLVADMLEELADEIRIYCAKKELAK